MEGSPKPNARRRRLVERGSDRLAFITGQTRDLPSEPYPDSPFRSSGPQISEPHGGIGKDEFSNIVQLPKLEPSDLVPEIQPTRDLRQQNLNDRTQSNESDLLQKFKTTSALPEIQPVNELPLHRQGNEILSNMTSNNGAASVQRGSDMETRPRSSVAPNQSTQSDNSSWSLETLKELVDFTPHEISQAISATEYNRRLASIGIAFLVVLSHWGLDVGGTITRVLVCTRPFLFLIITNITLVMSLLMDNKDPNARGRSASSNLGSADSLGQMLELGFLLQKALEGLLMDCSVCAVIMICFLGFW